MGKVDFSYFLPRRRKFENIARKKENCFFFLEKEEEKIKLLYLRSFQKISPFCPKMEQSLKTLIDKLDVEGVENALKSGTNPNGLIGSKYRGEYTPLEWLFRSENAYQLTLEGRYNDQQKILDLLLKYGALPRIEDGKNGVTSLYLAVYRKNYDAALKLLQAGADPNVAVVVSGAFATSEETPFGIVANHEPGSEGLYLQVFEEMLKRGARVKSEYFIYSTSRLQDKKIILLLKYGADPNANTNNLFDFVFSYISGIVADPEFVASPNRDELETRWDNLVKQMIWYGASLTNIDSQTNAITFVDTSKYPTSRAKDRLGRAISLAQKNPADRSDKIPYNNFIEACVFGYLSVIKFWYQTQPELYQQLISHHETDGNTPLHFALVNSQNPALLDFLIHTDNDPETMLQPNVVGAIPAIMLEELVPKMDGSYWWDWLTQYYESGDDD